MLSEKKVELLKKLQHQEQMWTAEFLTHGGCSTVMLPVEREIKSLRNQLKHQDVQEKLAATGG